MVHPARRKQMWLLSAAGALALCALALVGLLWSIARQAKRQAVVRQEVERLTADIAQLERGDRDLNQLLGYLRSQSYVERESRLRLGLARPGERVLAVADQADGAASGTSGLAAPVERSPSGNAANWWRYLFQPLP